jgi:hypothetical protein
MEGNMRKISFLLVVVLVLTTLIPALPVLADGEEVIANTFNVNDTNPRMLPISYFPPQLITSNFLIIFMYGVTKILKIKPLPWQVTLCLTTQRSMDGIPSLMQ